MDPLESLMLLYLACIVYFAGRWLLFRIRLTLPPLLYLTKYDINEEKDVIIDIAGRGNGNFARILRWFGREMNYVIQVTKESITMETSGFAGTRDLIVPISLIDRADLTSARSTSGIWLVLGGVFLSLLSFQGHALTQVLFVFGLSLIFLGMYSLAAPRLARRTQITIYYRPGQKTGFSFARTQTDITIESNTAFRTVEIINKLVNETEPSKATTFEDIFSTYFNRKM